MKKLFFFLSIAFLACNTNSSSVKVTEENKTDTRDRVLFIVSNAHFYGKSDINAANHFAEIVFPYDVLVKAGYAVDFVSPDGGAIPLGYLQTSDPLIKQYLYDSAGKRRPGDRRRDHFRCRID